MVDSHGTDFWQFSVLVSKSACLQGVLTSCLDSSFRYDVMKFVSLRNPIICRLGGFFMSSASFVGRYDVSFMVPCRDPVSLRVSLPSTLWKEKKKGITLTAASQVLDLGLGFPNSPSRILLCYADWLASDPDLPLILILSVSADFFTLRIWQHTMIQVFFLKLWQNTGFFCQECEKDFLYSLVIHVPIFPLKF